MLVLSTTPPVMAPAGAGATSPTPSMATSPTSTACRCLRIRCPPRGCDGRHTVTGCPSEENYFAELTGPLRLYADLGRCRAERPRTAPAEPVPGPGGAVPAAPGDRVPARGATSGR